MKVFNDIRKILVDPSENGQLKRAEIAKTSGIVKGLSGLAMYGSGTISIISAIAMKTYPMIGGFFTLLGLVTTAGLHEVKAVAENTEAMTTSITTQVLSALSEEQFMQNLTKDTWVVGPLFGTTIARGLKQAKD